MNPFTAPVGFKKIGWEKIDIQRMEIRDLEDVLSIETTSSPTPWSLNMFAHELQHPNAFCFVMKPAKGGPPLVIGFICFRNVIEESELLNIAVHPHHRRLGYGKKLMEFYIDFCRPLGIKTFYLEVNPSNQAAIHLYQIFDFKCVGRREKFYQGRFDALLFRKNI